ncbi:hypothetical protein KBC97_00160 [Candidatus Gracilibacteria bacterium]|nr:hypothetical protein [Candidatus Gracilibacteria bacterium]
MEETKNAPEVQKDPAGLLDGIYEDFKKTLDKYTSERQKADPSKDLVVLKDKEKSPFEAPRSVWAQNFELGQYLAAKRPEIKDKEAVYFMTGGVDRTVFNKKIKREDMVAYKYEDKEGKEHKVGWYEDATATAKKFVAFSDRIDADGFSTMEDGEKKERMTTIMTAISKMTEFTDAAWTKMIEENKFTEEEIYGPEGAYNLLLSFNRAVGNIDLTEDPTIAIGKDVDGNDVEVPVIYKIKLKIAKKSGNRKKDRFGKVVEVKVKKVEEPKKKEETKPKPVEPAKPAEPAKPVEKPKPAEPAKPQENPQPKPVEPAKPQENPQPKPVEPAKPVEKPKENFAAMEGELRSLNIVVNRIPTKFGETVYAQYGEKRLNVTFESPGVYSFKMVNLPDGRPAVEGKNVNAMKIKTDLDAAIADKLKAMVSDLANVVLKNPGANNPSPTIELTPLTGIDPITNAAYEDNTYKVTVRNYQIESSKDHSISAPANYTFEIKVSKDLGYSGETEGGQVLVGDKNDKKSVNPDLFLKASLSQAYEETLGK